MGTTVLNREGEAGVSGEQPARRAAYADLVAAILDLRSPVATATFDRALSDAVGSGRLSEELARELRWLQRESLRDVVAHAAAVLPATLVALDGPADPSEPDYAEPQAAEVQDEDVEQDPAETVPTPPADLTARRLLVAGLRPISDPPFP